MNTRMQFTLSTALALALAALGIEGRSTQATPVSAADVQRLEDAVTELETDLSALHVRDVGRARSFESELQDLRDEVVYLKVGIRKDAAVSRQEYTTLQGRIESLRQRIKGTNRAQPAGVGESVPAATQPDAVSTSPQEDQAKDVLAQVRKALGGDEKIAALKTLSGDGTFRRTIGGNEVAGKVEIHLAMPDRFQRIEQPILPSGTAGPRFVTTLNGAEGWVGLIGQPPTAPPPRVGQGPPPDPTGRIRGEFRRLMIALFPGSQATSGVTFTYVGKTQPPERDMHVLEAKTQDSFVMQLFVDAAQHLPLRLAYTGRDPSQGGPRLQRRPGETPEQTRQRVEEERRQRDAQGPPTPPRVAIVWAFEDHKPVDGLTLPHRLTATAAAKPIWTWEIAQFRLNATLDPSQFVKKSN